MSINNNNSQNNNLRTGRVWLQDKKRKLFILNQNQNVQTNNNNWNDALYQNIACKRRRSNEDRVCKAIHAYTFILNLQKPILIGPN